MPILEQFYEQLTRQLGVWAPKVAMAIGILAAFWIASSLVRRFVFRLSGSADFGTRYVLRLTGRTASVALLFFGGVTALGTMDVNVSALVAGLGLIGFALGFGLKDILSNFVSGVLILLYRPFGLRDHITVTGLEGIVTAIDLRYTRLEKNGQAFLIPNSMLITNTIGIQSQTQEQMTALRPVVHS